MDKPRHLLVVIDPTATEQPALLRARVLALAFGARIELFACFPAHASARLRLDEMTLERLANGLREQGIDVTTDEASAPTLHDGIVRKVVRAHPSLVIEDTHPHSLLHRSVLGNTDWQLIRLCPAPLLFVRPGEWRRPPRIAAAVDTALPGEKPAALDHLLLSMAESVARATDGKLHAVHAYLPVSDFTAMATALAVPMVAGVNPRRIVADRAELARARFDELLATHAVPRERRHLLAGPPAEQLVDFARAAAIDVLVMGAVARGWMHDVFVGSTTERVLDLLPCDVLVVKPASVEWSLAERADQPAGPARPRAAGIAPVGVSRDK